MDQQNLNKLKIALQQIEAGEDINVVKANLSYVNYNQQLIDKINILKKIPILNEDILKYLYSIQLTDKVANVEPKVNAIYQLAVSSKLISDEELEKAEKKHDEKESIIVSNEVQTAVNVINSLLHSDSDGDN